MGGRSKPKPSVGRLQREGPEQVVRNGEKTGVGERMRQEGGEAGTEQGGEGCREVQKWRERKSEQKGDPEGQRTWEREGRVGDWKEDWR